MLINITASMCFLIVLSILMVDFSSKETLDNLDNNSFKHLSIACMLGLFIEFLDYSMVLLGYDIHSPIMLLLGKVVFLYYIVFMYYFILYVYSTCKNIQSRTEKYEKFRKVLTFIYSIFTILVIVLPYDFAESTEYLYPVGLATDFSYIVGGLAIAFIFILSMFNLKNLKQQKGMPIICGIVGAIISMIAQYTYHELLLLIPSHAIAIIFMYFTIENPDLKLLRQMELAKDQAEKANRAKSDFLSSMSHEIRTPLNAIVGLSEDNLSYKDQLPPDVIENSEDIMSASQTLLEIVGNILDINKIEANKMEIVEAPYNFKEEIENLAKIDATRIGEKPIDFKVSIAEDIPYELLGDKIHMKEIVNNLLTNAIKYTDQGEIELNVKCINKGDISNLIISVKDTGKGIKADHINRLFTKFDRLDVELNTTTEGTGLGLAITKALVEMMGGKINVQSQFGKGSIFMVQVPQKISKLSGPIQVVEQTKVESSIQSSVEPIKPIVESNLIGPVQEQQKSNIQNTLSIYGNKKILIADDNKLNIKVARKALQDFNFEIDECYDGLECVEKVKIGNEYDLILMDIMMPNMSGESALKKLKENPSFNIPTIALTADAVSGAEEKYKSEGFIDYIAKPFKKEQIKEKLDMIFSKSISNDENIITNNTELNNNEDVIYDMEPNNNIVSSEEKINETDSMLVSALSDMSKPLNEIDVQDKVSEEVHVIGNDAEDIDNN